MQVASTMNSLVPNESSEDVSQSMRPPSSVGVVATMNSLVFNELAETNTYIPPSGAYYVSTTGSDSANGQSAPWATIGHALSTAPAGSTIVIHGGTYREGEYYIYNGFTLQPYYTDSVTIKGSVVVTSWVATGSIWKSTGWTYQFTDDTDPNAINPSYPLAGHPDQVFFDGIPLTLVANQAAVGPGKFYVDYPTSTLYIGNNPTGHVVEGVTRKFAIKLEPGTTWTVQGLNFLHYGTDYNTNQGALIVYGSGTTIRNCTFSYCSHSGLAAFSGSYTITGNSCSNNGEKGFTAWRIDGSTISNNTFNSNNWRNFSMDWSASGSKIVTSRNLTYFGNSSGDNLCTGHWFDISCSNVNIVNNISVNDGKQGIQYEISDHAIIASNLMIGAAFAGIRIGGDSSYIQFYNNTMINNVQNLYILRDSRTQYPTDSIICMNNILWGCASGAPNMVETQDISGSPETSEQMGIVLNYNGYYKTGSSVPPTLVSWGEGASQSNYASVSAFNSARGQEASGLEVDGGSDPFFVGGGDYHVRSGSVASNSGTPLPPAVAAAMGLPANGNSVDLGILL